MADRAHIPSSPACGQWETLLADALDGLLKPEDEATFAEHMAGCKACTALFDESRRGREWLEYLSPEPEVPADLLDKILAQTGPGQVAGYGLLASSGDVLPALHARKTPAWQRPGFMGQIRRFAEPRLLMTAAMAFFSIALTLKLTGVRLNEVRMADFRPAAVRSYMERRFTTASVPIIRYYDHLRFMYEVESRMRELRRTTEGDNSTPTENNATPGGPGESKQSPGQAPGHKDGGSRVNPPPQQSGRPDAAPAQNECNDLVEASLTFHGKIRAFRRLQNGTTGMEGRERSTVWTA
jgi:Putative zinc-finger